MSDAPVTLPPDFDPFKQNFTIYTSAGFPVVVDIPTLDEFITQNSEVCVVYGSQLGASLIMLVVVLLTSKESKRRSPIFILNVLSLIFSFFRSLSQILYWLGPWTEIYRNLALDYDTVPRSAYSNSVASVVLTLLLLMTIEASLVLQTNVVCQTLTNRLRWPIIALSMVITLLAVGFRFGLTIRNAEGILNLTYTPDTLLLGQASLITETISIWFFCLIFVIKLGWTLYRRKRLGLKQWGPMQIITIMGGCTMIIPSIFAVLDYFPEDSFYEAGTLAICLVAIMLPLSSVWAAAAIDDEHPVRSFEPRPKFGSYDTAMGSEHRSCGPSTRSMGKVHALVDHCSRASEEGSSRGHVMRLDSALGMHLSAGGVRIERSYEVHSGEGSRNGTGQEHIDLF